MAFMTFKESKLAPVEDAQTLKAVFDAAASVYEDFVTHHKRTLDSMDALSAETADSTRRHAESAFAGMVENIRFLTLLPELRSRDLMDVLVIGLVDGAYRMAMYDNAAPGYALRKMQSALPQSPRNDFYQAAIRELAEGDLDAGWPSVARKEYATLDALHLVNRAKYLLDRAEFLGVEPMRVHPKELENRNKVEADLRALAAVKDIPETLRVMGGRYAAHLSNLRHEGVVRYTP